VLSGTLCCGLGLKLMHDRRTDVDGSTIYLNPTPAHRAVELILRLLICIEKKEPGTRDSDISKASE
jgi:hypothetical protein